MMFCGYNLQVVGTLDFRISDSIWALANAVFLDQTLNSHNTSPLENIHGHQEIVTKEQPGKMMKGSTNEVSGSYNP